MSFEQHTYQLTGTTGGTHMLEIDEIYERHYISVELFSDSTFETSVDTATMAGDIIVDASDNGTQFADIESNGTITLGTSSYGRPNLSGNIKVVRINFNGVTNFNGATHFILNVNSNRG